MTGFRENVQKPEFLTLNEAYYTMFFQLNSLESDSNVLIVLS